MLSENTLEILYEHYDNPSDQEFEEDITRILYVFRLINRYVAKKNTNYKLLINHIIVLYNVFGRYAPIALHEYALTHKTDDILDYLNAVLKVCGRLEEDMQFNKEFLNALENSINDK